MSTWPPYMYAVVAILLGLPFVWAGEELRRRTDQHDPHEWPGCTCRMCLADARRRNGDAATDEWLADRELAALSDRYARGDLTVEQLEEESARALGIPEPPPPQRHLPEWTRRMRGR